MFFFYSVLAMIGYTLQYSLLVHFSRKIKDGLTVAMYRNLSCIVILLPLLFFVDFSEINGLIKYLPYFFIMAVTAVVSLTLSFWALKYIPAGIHQAFRAANHVIFLSLYGYVFYQETISGLQALFFILILGSGTMIILQKVDFSHLSKKWSKGLLLQFVATFLGSISIFLAAKISREFSPFCTGYIWESSIGILAFFVWVGRNKFSFNKIKYKFNLRDFLGTALATTPILLGTFSFVQAIQLGSIGIYSAIGAGGILVSTLFAHYFYRENLSRITWLWLVLIFLSIVGFKLTGV